MKIRSLLFFTVAITFVAAVSYHLGSSMQGKHFDRQSIRTPVIEPVHSVPTPKDTVLATCPEQNTMPAPGPDISKKTAEIEADFVRRKQKTEEYYAERFRTLRENAETALKKLDYPDKTAYAHFIEQLNDAAPASSVYTGMTGRISPDVNASADDFHTETTNTRVIGKSSAAYELKVRQLNKAADDIISEYNLDCGHFERQKACALSDLEKEKKLALTSISYKESAKPMPPKTPGTVTGIISSNGAPLTIVNGNVFREGQSINGVKVVKINRDSVEFENAGSHWSQKVNEPPSTNWP